MIPNQINALGDIELTAGQALNPDVETFQRRFEEDYAALFGRVVDGMDIEITVWAVNATTPSQAVARVTAEAGGASAQTAGQRDIFDPALGEAVTASVVLRDDIGTGQTVAGPAAITEDETTIILPSSRRAVRQPDGCIDVMIQGKG